MWSAVLPLGGSLIHLKPSKVLLGLQQALPSHATFVCTSPQGACCSGGQESLKSCEAKIAMKLFG